MLDIIPPKKPVKKRAPKRLKKIANINLRRTPSRPAIGGTVYHFVRGREAIPLLTKEGLGEVSRQDVRNSPLIQERDIPYSFAPQRSETPSFTIIQPASRGKTFLGGALFLIVGFGIILFCMWGLQGAGRGTAALTRIQSRVAQALSHVQKGQEALADARGTDSAASFSASSNEFLHAKQELDSALTDSKAVLEFLDITGKIEAGDRLLVVGKLLTQSGEVLANVLSPFLDVNQDTYITDILEKSRPSLLEVQEYLGQANEVLKKVDEGSVPKDIANRVSMLKESVPRIYNAVLKSNQEMGTFLELLGAARDRQYLLLFANSDEIRPVGGFIGSTGFVNIAKGKVESIDVKSVYDGDGQLKEFLAPPNQLLPIVDRWYLRDSNWFVDFSASAQKAAQLFEKEGGSTVDGVILLTPNVIKNILHVTGPIEVPGYEETVTEDNFVVLTQHEVTYQYDRQLNKPKKFLNDLAPILFTKLFASSGEHAPGKLAILSALTKSLSEKEMLLYFRNEKAQQQVANIGWGGTIVPNAQGYLMVNNANIGGHKSDQFIEQEIDYRSAIEENGDVDVVLTVRRTHHGPTERPDYPYPEGEDPSKKDNIIYQRTYVPNGAELLEATGFSSSSQIPKPATSGSHAMVEPDPEVVAWQQSQRQGVNGTAIGTESGYTYFANWVITKPGQTSVTLYHYRIPAAVDMPGVLDSASSYALSIAKQPGQGRTRIRASISVPSAYTIAQALPDSGGTRESRESFVYRGDLTEDVVPGIVFER